MTIRLSMAYYFSMAYVLLAWKAGAKFFAPHAGVIIWLDMALSAAATAAAFWRHIPFSLFAIQLLVVDVVFESCLVRDTSSPTASSPAPPPPPPPPASAPSTTLARKTPFPSSSSFAAASAAATLSLSHVCVCVGKRRLLRFWPQASYTVTD